MTRSSAKWSLSNIRKGQRITVTATAACGSTGTIVLKDDSNVYATLKKSSMDHRYQYLGEASSQYNGGENLRLEMDIEHISYQISIKSIVTNTNIVDSFGKVVGCVYVIAVEDYNDYDYNDIVVTITVTNK